jgi:hypothetical protein
MAAIESLARYSSRFKAPPYLVCLPLSLSSLE